VSEHLDDRDSYSMANRSIAKAIDAVGTRSALLIVREALSGTRRFDEFARRIGIGEPATAARLKDLTAAGLLERAPYQQPGQRTRYEYQLTAKGRDLLPVIVALRQWRDRWAVDNDGPPLVMRHNGCGAPVHAELCCVEGHHVDADGTPRSSPAASTGSTTAAFRASSSLCTPDSSW
jgi:DNA-binding HxlR family transcriptional regulator